MAIISFQEAPGTAVILAFEGAARPLQNPAFRAHKSFLNQKINKIPPQAECFNGLAAPFKEHGAGMA